MEKYKGAVFIGRFQPFHNGHLEVLRHAMNIADKVLLILGSAHSSRDIKNPFTYPERVLMISSCFGISSQLEQIQFEPQRDYFYDEPQWRLEVTEKIKKYFKLTDSLALVGMYKDESSSYLNNFPFLEFVPTPQATTHDATTVRRSMFLNPSCDKKNWEDNIVHETPWKNSVHCKVEDFLNDFIETEEFSRLQKEYNYIQNYKKTWAKSPFPPTFVTSDFVLKSGKNILVVKRKLGVGKGLLALPGGFIKQQETTQNAAIRELREETSLNLSPEKLRLSIQDSKVFDYPNRSLRGRTITHAFYGVIPSDEELPIVSGADDAAEAFWIPIFEVYERSNEFFEDHFHIIHYFLTKEK